MTQLVVPTRKSSRTHRLSQRALESMNIGSSSSNTTNDVDNTINNNSKSLKTKQNENKEHNINKNSSSSLDNLKSNSSNNDTLNNRGTKRSISADSKEINKKSKTCSKQSKKQLKNIQIEDEQITSEQEIEEQEFSEQEEEQNEEQDKPEQKTKDERFPTVESHLNLKKLEFEPLFSTMVVSSNLKIDLHSEMRLQRQRRLLQLALLNDGGNEELDDDDILDQFSLDNNNDFNFDNITNNQDDHDEDEDEDEDDVDSHIDLFDEAILSSEDDEIDEDFITTKKYKDFQPPNSLNNSTSDVYPNANDLPMGLESVDKIIYQINSINEDNKLLKEYSDLSSNLFNNNNNNNNNTSNTINTNITSPLKISSMIESLRNTANNVSNSESEQMRWPLTPTDNLCSFESLGNIKQKRNLIKKSSKLNNRFIQQQNQKQEELINNDDDSNGIEEFLNLNQTLNDEDEVKKNEYDNSLGLESPKSPNSSSEDDEELSPTTPTSNSNNSYSPSMMMSFLHKGPLEYRYNDQLNLALVDDANIKPLKNIPSNRNNKRALKRRAVFTGKAYSEMVNTGASFGIQDFLI